MLNPYVVICSVVMIIFALAFVTVAEYVPLFKGKPKRQGLLLGLMAFITVLFPTCGYNFHVCVGFMDFSVILSGLFFGPVACMISTGIAILAKLLVAFFGFADIIVSRGCTATLLIGVYIIVVTKISLNGKRPSVIAALVSASFGEIVHNLFLFVSGLNIPSATFEIVYVTFFPMVCTGGTIAALYALICPRTDGSFRFRESNTIAFLFFAVAFGAVFATGLFGVKRSIKQCLQSHANNFRQTIAEYIAFSMHRCTRSICSKIDNYQTVTQEELAKLADDHALNEVNIISADNAIVTSSSKEVMRHKGEHRSWPEDIRFRKMVRNDDPRAVVKRTIRKSLIPPHDETCFIEIPFPDKSAFLKPGYGESKFHAEFQEIFVPQLAEKTISDSGYFLIIDNNGKIVGPVAKHQDAIAKNIADIGLQRKNIQFGDYFVAHLFGEYVQCFCFVQYGEHRVLACLPLWEYFIPMFMNYTMTGIALLFLTFLFNWMMRRVEKLNREKEEHVKEELAFARSIQEAELKEDVPETSTHRICAIVRPAKIIGGDFYDYYTLENGKIVIGIADVSGKGMPAAIFMMKAKTTLKLYSYRCDNMQDIMEISNDEICKKNPTQMFVTAWGGVFDPLTGDVDYVCAGHNRPLIVRANGEVEWVNCMKNVPLGLAYDRKYKTQRLHLNHGDRLFLYTDGVNEAFNVDHQEYGNERLFDTLSHVKKNVTLIDAVMQDLNGFVGNTEQSDDITMLSLLYK